MTTVVTDEQAEALRLLEGAVAVRGADFNYREHFGVGKFDDDDGSDPGSCLYVHEDAAGKLIPGCIVGMVLHNLGVDLYAVREHEGMSAYDLMTTYSDFGGLARMVFVTAQEAQDRGGTWGDALTRARAAAGTGGA